MRVLVTGGAGYIGSVTSQMLLDQGYEVVIFDNLERGHRQAIDGRARFVKGDLRDKAGIAGAMRDARPDAVMHFAAYALVGESMEHPEMYWQNNVVGSINLAEAMSEVKVKNVVFSSTCATYGEPEHMPMTEGEPQKPTNPYGASKLMIETVLRWQQQIQGIKVCFLRYFNACGATDKFGEDHDPESHLIPIVLQVALGRRESVAIFGDDYDTPDGTCIRDYIHVSDLAQAHVLALMGDHSGAFNLGNGDGSSVRQVIDVAREVTGHPIPTVIGTRRPGDPPRLVADARKAVTELKWKPAFPSLVDIVSSAWKWHRAHPRGYGD